MSCVMRESDNVYLNVVFNQDPNTLINPPSPNPSNNVNPPLVYPIQNFNPAFANYSVSKTTPIVDNVGDYYLSVVRFDIPLNETPLYIMPIVPNQANPNLTPLVIGIRNGATIFSNNVIYVPDNMHTPPIQDKLKQVITNYYFVYTYQNLIDSINVALNASYVGQGFNLLFPGIEPPRFVYEATPKLISLIIPSFFVKLTAPLLTIPVIFINGSLINYLESFPLYFYSYNANNEAFDFKLSNLSIANSYTYPNIPITNPPTYYIVEQEYPSIQLWSSLRKILITTGTIPINNEFIPASSDDSGVNISRAILTDFIPNLSNAGDSRQIAYYVPPGQYRLVDMIGTTPLFKISLSIFWEDHDNNIYPVNITVGQQASVKLAFIRKSLYKNNLLKTL